MFGLLVSHGLSHSGSLIRVMLCDGISYRDDGLSLYGMGLLAKVGRISRRVCESDFLWWNRLGFAMSDQIWPTSARHIISFPLLKNKVKTGEYSSQTGKSQRRGGGRWFRQKE